MGTSRPAPQGPFLALRPDGHRGPARQPGHPGRALPDGPLDAIRPPPASIAWSCPRQSVVRLGPPSLPAAAQGRRPRIPPGRPGNGRRRWPFFDHPGAIAVAPPSAASWTLEGGRQCPRRPRRHRAGDMLHLEGRYDPETGLILHDRRFRALRSQATALGKPPRPCWHSWAPRPPTLPAKAGAPWRHGQPSPRIWSWGFMWPPPSWRPCERYGVREPLNVHPDEADHVSAGRGFSSPTGICRPRTIPGWPTPSATTGVSHLATAFVVVYFFAGKFAAPVLLLGQDYLALRFFNVFCSRSSWSQFLPPARRPQDRLPAALLFITPQIWYAFSYFQCDVLPLFLKPLPCGAGFIYRSS